LTVKLWPATSTRPTRRGPPFCATEIPTVPEAFPDCPDVIAIHSEALTAFQTHPVRVETPTDSWPPAAVIASLLRLSSKRHGTPAWLT
jgi:hypothetical protein